MRKTPKRKWKFAIGTTSRVPGTSRHYVILDIDHNRPNSAIRRLQKVLGKKVSIFCQPTRHGWHIYTNYSCSFRNFLRIAKGIADRTWLRIASSRGYAFLADKSAVIVPWSVERMIIHYGKTFNA